MKILVTGGSGLVGYGIQQISSQYDYEFIFLSSKDCDLTNYEKTLKTFTLLNQACIRDQNITVEEFIKNHVSLLGENIQLTRFTKFELGETDKDEK